MNPYEYASQGSQAFCRQDQCQAKKEAALATADAARAQYQGAVLLAFQNVADTLYALDNDKQALAAAQGLETANQQLLELTENQFKAGYIARPQLLAARQALLQAK